MAHRPLAPLAALAALLALAAAPAQAGQPPVDLRVEAPGRTVFEGTVRPVVGDLADAAGDVHTTSVPTPLGALVRASRNRGFGLDLAWFDCCGGGWAGFFVTEVAGEAADDRRFWAFKVGQTLSPAGAGAVRAEAGMNALFYLTRFDPATGATQRTLGITASDRTPRQGQAVAFTVRKYDDAGDATRARNAYVHVGAVAAGTGDDGRVKLRFGDPGRHCVDATKQRAIRSRTLCVTVSS